jgi:Ser/Thr protein kinase RdoA (MazF antagonist)
MLRSRFCAVYFKLFPRVLDITIAMAYDTLTSYGKSNRSLSAMAAILHGYHSVYPLTDIEREHLVLLVACRLACSVTLGAFSWQQNPHNTYLLLHSELAWRA